MADIGTFPTIRNVLVYGDNITTFTATTAVKAGQVVAINATGVSNAVDPCVNTSGCQPVGVALYGAAAGALVAVAGTGCVVTIANADDTATFDAGDVLEGNDNTVGGTVSVSSVAASGGATATAHPFVVGYAEEDIAASGTGRMRIQIMPQNYQVNSS